ncbi:hypothetical protein [Synechococcus sp.]|uniref:hypothetical protein n=1 Tax=Synechococcus sp. TaxID=1131 RepID=UPI0034A51B6D
MLRSSTDGSFKANISRGGDGQAFPLNPELERLARDSAASPEPRHRRCRPAV